MYNTSCALVNHNCIRWATETPPLCRTRHRPLTRLQCCLFQGGKCGVQGQCGWLTCPSHCRTLLCAALAMRFSPTSVAPLNAPSAERRRPSSQSGSLRRRAPTSWRGTGRSHRIAHTLTSAPSACELLHVGQCVSYWEGCPYAHPLHVRYAAPAHACVQLEGGCVLPRSGRGRGRSNGRRNPRACRCAVRRSVRHGE